MQTTAIRTVAYSLPKNEVIILTLLISKRYIPYTDLHKICGIFAELQQINAKVLEDWNLWKKSSIFVIIFRETLYKTSWK